MTSLCQTTYDVITASCNAIMLLCMMYTHFVNIRTSKAGPEARLFVTSTKNCDFLYRGGRSTFFALKWLEKTHIQLAEMLPKFEARCYSYRISYKKRSVHLTPRVVLASCQREDYLHSWWFNGMFQIINLTMRSISRSNTKWRKPAGHARQKYIYTI